MTTDILYAYDATSGDYVKRIVGHTHGDGQTDSDAAPVWLLTSEDEAADACGGEARVPTIKL